MTSDRWRQLTAIYDAAIARDAHEREAFVREACGTDTALAREVISLLASPTSAAAFLSTPVVGAKLDSGTSSGDRIHTAVLRAGEVIGQYRIEGLVGRGGMGEVYRALDLRLGRDVAVKILPPALTSDPNRLARFEGEARVLASLNHPHIGAIYGVEDRGDIRALVLEFVEGRTLDELVPLPVPQALAIARQIADALDAAHERGIVHRDLKPANVKVTTDGAVKLLDFGLAKVHVNTANFGAAPDRGTVAHHTEEGLILGTVAYMSPEQARGQLVDKRTDIWAFGCVLFEMLTARRPFEGDTGSDVLAAILERDVNWTMLPEPTPEPVRRLLARCLEKNPRLRLRDIGDARAELDSAADRGGVATDRGPARLWRRREWLAVAGLPAVGAFAAGRYWPSRPSLSPPRPAPTFRRVTFRRGSIWSARFSNNVDEILYSATWEGGSNQLYSTRLGDPESRPVHNEDADLLSVSRTGELALALDPLHRGGFTRGTLARMGASGVSPRRVRESVVAADWNPEGTDVAIARWMEDTRSYQLEYPPDNVLYKSKARITAVRMAPDGHSMAVGDVTSVFIVDLARQKTELSKDWAVVFSVAWSPSGDEVWFSGSDLNSGRPMTSLFGVSRTGRRRTLLAYPDGTLLWDTARDGRVLIGTGPASKGIKYLDRKTRVERDLSWLDWSLVNAISQDGSMLLLTEGGQAGGLGRSVYYRPVDGSPAVRLGSGFGLSFSPDGTAVLALGDTAPGTNEIERLVLLPVGAGPTRTLTSPSFHCTDAHWLPDGRHILVSGSEPGQPRRTWLYDLGGTVLRPVTPEGVIGHYVARDGVRFVAGPIPAVHNLTNGERRAIPGATADDEAIGWDADGRHIYVRRDFQPDDVNRVTIIRINVETGRREPWDHVYPEAVRAANSLPMAISPNGRMVAYTYLRTASSLFVVEGVK